MSKVIMVNYAIKIEKFKSIRKYDVLEIRNNVGNSVAEKKCFLSSVRGIITLCEDIFNS